MHAVREETKLQSKKYEKTEDDLKALQGVGQLIGEVLRQLDSEKCALLLQLLLFLILLLLPLLLLLVVVYEQRDV